MINPRSSNQVSSHNSAVEIPTPALNNPDQRARSGQGQQVITQVTVNNPLRHGGNYSEADMPVNLWGIDRRDAWRTCFCFHVRTMTIIIGVWHLMSYILCLSFAAAIFMYEPPQDGYSMTARPAMLPTPVSSKFGDGVGVPEMPQPDSLTIDRSLDPNPRARLENFRNGPLTFVMETKKANSQVVLLTVCNILITLLMVYGSVRGKPSYLMPFFVLRVFDFCIFCLTMVGYFSYLPDVTQDVHKNHFPFREYLVDVDPQLLSLLTLLLIVGMIAYKAYIIGVVWNCYKYLMLRNSVIRTVIAYRHDGADIMGMQQNLLPDLPDYETAVSDPRYAKKPPLDSAPKTSTNINGNQVLTASTIVIPPPPYSVAVASEPLTYDFTVAAAANQSTSAGESNSQPEQTETDNGQSSSVTVETVNAHEAVAVHSQAPVASPDALTCTTVSVCQHIDVAPAVSIDIPHHQ